MRLAKKKKNVVSRVKNLPWQPDEHGNKIYEHGNKTYEHMGTLEYLVARADFCSGI